MAFASMKSLFWSCTIFCILILVSVYLYSSENSRFQFPPLKDNTENTTSKVIIKEMIIEKCDNKTNTNEANKETSEKCNCNKTKETTDAKADVKTTESTMLRETVAKELHEIHLEMQKLLVHKDMPSPELVQRVGELEKRLEGKSESTTPSSDINSTSGSLDVCPEEYKGTKFGYPFYGKGWVLTECTNAKPLSSVINILVNTVAYPQEDEKHISNVFKGINETYPTVQVYVATRSNDIVEAAKKYKNIDVVKVDDTKVAKAWNTLKSKSSTPYVLVARDVVHFSWLAQVERQIRLVSQIPNVGVAGGAYCNMSGHWKAGCVQTKLLSYVLEYQEGYYHSKDSCMFCDYLQGPFVAKTDLFKLEESLPDEVVFEDFFLRISQDGHQVMTCPDAMYFTSDYTSYSKSTNKDVWTPLAKKWELNRVLLPQGVKYSFSCKEVGLTCKPNHELLPVCCLEDYANVLEVLQKFCVEHNISFELDHGSLLGGVKFNGLLPYDIDGDIVVLSTQIEIFSKEETKKHFQNNGYSLYGYQAPHFDKKMGKIIHGFTYIGFNGFPIEVWGMWDLTNLQQPPPELQNLASFTKANIRGNWVNTACSPGMFARNRYGREILKHSQSWRKRGLQDSWRDYVAGIFKPCSKPKHHWCLDNFRADGNIAFRVD